MHSSICWCGSRSCISSRPFHFTHPRIGARHPRSCAFTLHHFTCPTTLSCVALRRAHCGMKFLLVLFESGLTPRHETPQHHVQDMLAAALGAQYSLSVSRLRLGQTAIHVSLAFCRLSKTTAERCARRRHLRLTSRDTMDAYKHFAPQDVSYEVITKHAQDNCLTDLVGDT